MMMLAFNIDSSSLIQPISQNWEKDLSQLHKLLESLIMKSYCIDSQAYIYKGCTPVQVLPPHDYLLLSAHACMPFYENIIPYVHHQLGIVH